jgi:hypothetical protein
MRGPATGAPRPPRHDPQPALGVADPPAPGMTPPGQHPRAPRTHQPARTEPFLDHDGVGLYPPQPGQGHSGRAVA